MSAPRVRGVPRPSARVTAFILLCVIGAATIALYLYKRAEFNASDGRRKPPTSVAGDVALLRKPHILFRNTDGPTWDRLGVVPLDAPGGAWSSTPLTCTRVYFAVDRGICLRSTDTGGLLPATNVVIFDAGFGALFSQTVTGLPTRARVSPDGRIGAMTVFVSGDSYAAANFSTRTRFLDLHSGQLLGDLEKFSVFRNGQRFQSLDFNFWGVTFAHDSTTFYATLGTGGNTYLVQGDLASRQVRVLRSNVECPSISPDGRRIAFKKRVDGGLGLVEWRLSVLDLATLQDWPLAETRSVDDQAEWLDNHRILYGIQEEDSRVNTWIVPDDGSGRPQMLMSNAGSPTVVRG